MSVTGRLAWTLVSGLLLSSLFGVYVGLVSPRLAVPRRAEPLAAGSDDFPSGPPRDNAEWARRYLPEWAVTARWQGRWGQTYFFAGRQEAIDEARVVRFAPFALIHVPVTASDDSTTGPATGPRAGEAEPVVILADSAVVRFPDSVDLDDPDPRLAIGCRLDGAVEVIGADGLRIRGGNFLFDREAMMVVSNDPVRLAWSGHTGRADGVEVQLGNSVGGRPEDSGTRSPVSRRVGLPAGPIESVRLLRDVELEMALENRDVSAKVTGRSRPWKISCDGPMVVDPVRLLATFVDTVRVQRPAESGQWDNLDCQRLSLRFRRHDASTSGQGTGPAQKPAQVRQADSVLRFVQFEALGAPVRVTSVVQDLEARTNRLVYRADGGTMELAGEVAAVWKRGRLVCDQVVLSRGADGRIDRANCRGAGTMTWQHPGPRPVPLMASWSGRMTFSPEPGSSLDLVVLEGKPLVRYGVGSALTAESIRIWLNRDPDRRLVGQAGSLSTSARITRLIARDQVGVIMPGAYVGTGLLDVSFEPLPVSKVVGASATRPVEPLISAGDKAEEPDSPVDPAVVSSKSIRGRVGMPTGGGDWVLREAVIEGGVRLVRESSSGDDPVQVDGERIRIAETPGGGQGVTIEGRPAVLKSGDDTLSGPMIRLDNSSGRGSVEGSGSLSMPVEQLLSGDRAPRGTRLEVRWEERLVLDGAKFSFLGDVKSELGDSRVDCEQLDVTLSRAPDLSINGRGDRDLEFKTLMFRHSVHLTRYTFDPAGDGLGPTSRAKSPRLSEILKARLANLQVDLSTRDTKALGPGWIQFWQRGQRRHVPLAPTVLARANLPLELDAADWQYLRVDFSKSSEGNMDRGFATFDDQVQVVTGHVSRPGDVIDPDRLGRDAGWLQCDSLQVTREAVPGQEANAGVIPVSGSPTGLSSRPRRLIRGSLTLQARGDATGAGRLSSQSWFARAETISFNESSGRVVMSSAGQQKATLWRRNSENGPYSRVDARRLLMSLKTGEVVLDRASTTRFVPEGG